MGEVKQEAVSSAQPKAMHHFTHRAVLYFFLMAALAAVSLTKTVSIAQLTVLAAAALYFVCSSYWLRTTRGTTGENQHLDWLFSLDAFTISVAFAYVAHSYIMTALILPAICFNAFLIGAHRQILIDLGLFLIGTGAVSMLLHQQWRLEISELSLALQVMGIVISLILYADQIRNRFKKLNAINSKLYKDLVAHKVRTYKLSRYVTPTVWAALNSGQDASLKTERKRVTVFFSDIAGFSSLSEELEAETLTELLNTYLSEMAKIAAKHRGTIDKFMGDGLMVLFGDSKSDGMRADALRCVSMAIDMRKKMIELEQKWFNDGIKRPLKIRMGINSGYCTVGTFGTTEYMDYTVLGTHVNLASRLESNANSGEILISHETWSLIKDVVMCRDRGEMNAKGFSHPIKVYELVDFRKDLGRNQSYFNEHMQGFSMHLDLEKVKNYDRNRIIEQLEKLAEKLRDKF